MTRIILSQLYLYPVKSLGGIPLDAADVQERGLRHDRRWMLVDEDGRFLTQRDLPHMALVRVSVGSDQIGFSAPGRIPLRLPLTPPADAPGLTVRVWKSVCPALVVSVEADEWFSAYLGRFCRLVHMPETTRREVNPDYRRAAGIVSFADGYPLMVLSDASLRDLNARLNIPVPMNRFRPSLVVSGTEPYAEDGWAVIRIGGTVFHVVKPCDRCVMTTIDQATGEPQGGEPLKTLASYRLRNQKVPFGMHLIPETPGHLRLGDPIEVLEGKTA